MPPVVQIQVQRAEGDCAIVALSMYLGVGYEDVLASAVAVTGRRAHRSGLFTRDIKQVAKRLGTTLTLRRTFDMETACGVLALRKTTKGEKAQEEHAVLLRAGLVFDTDGTVWEPETYLEHHKYRVLSLLVADEDKE